MSDESGPVKAYAADICRALKRDIADDSSKDFLSRKETLTIGFLSSMLRFVCDDTSKIKELLFKHDKAGYISFLETSHSKEIEQKNAAIRSLESHNKKLSEENALLAMECNQANIERDEARQEARRLLEEHDSEKTEIVCCSSTESDGSTTTSAGGAGSGSRKRHRGVGGPRSALAFGRLNASSQP
jgi:hypothetical protein